MSMWKHKTDFQSTFWLNKNQLNWWAHLPAEGSDRHPFSLVTLKLPQRKKSTLLVPELIRRILIIFKIWKSSAPKLYRINEHKILKKKKKKKARVQLTGRLVFIYKASFCSAYLVLCNQMYSDWPSVLRSWLPWPVWGAHYSITETWRNTFKCKQDDTSVVSLYLCKLLLDATVISLREECW